MSGVPKIVDLSHKQNAASITWPDNPGYNFTILFRGFDSYNSWFVVIPTSPPSLSLYLSSCDSVVKILILLHKCFSNGIFSSVTHYHILTLN